MILTDREIKIAIDRGLISVEPPPGDDVLYTSTALDLRLDSRLRIYDPEVKGVDIIIDPSQPGFNADATITALSHPETIAEGGFNLQPHILILAWTIEYVTIPTNARLAARVEGKSSLARLGLGIHVTAPTIHAGFKGQIQLEIVNHGPRPIRLRTGMRICQLIFENTLGTPEKGYQGQFAGQKA